MMLNLRLMISSIIVVTLISISAYAHQGASGIILVRMEAMKSIASQMKQLKHLIFKNKIYDTKKVILSARIIKQHAEEMPSLFPKGSTQHPSEAAFNLWENWGAFLKEADKLAKSADLLINIASKENSKQPSSSKKSQMVKEFYNISQTCQSCHQSFRVKK